MTAPTESIAPSIDPAVLVKAEALLGALRAGAMTGATSGDPEAGAVATISLKRGAIVTEFEADGAIMATVNFDAFSADRLAINLLAFSAYLRSISATEAAPPRGASSNG